MHELETAQLAWLQGIRKSSAEASTRIFNPLESFSFNRPPRKFWRAISALSSRFTWFDFLFFNYFSRWLELCCSRQLFRAALSHHPPLRVVELNLRQPIRKAFQSSSALVGSDFHSIFINFHLWPFELPPPSISFLSKWRTRMSRRRKGYTYNAVACFPNDSPGPRPYTTAPYPVVKQFDCSLCIHTHTHTHSISILLSFSRFCHVKATDFHWLLSSESKTDCQLSRNAWHK